MGADERGTGVLTWVYVRVCGICGRSGGATSSLSAKEVDDGDVDGAEGMYISCAQDPRYKTGRHTVTNHTNFFTPSGWKHCGQLRLGRGTAAEPSFKLISAAKDPGWCW